jgi:hypothetical protein
MRVVLLIAAGLLASTLSYSQTKRIAHRSHSGTDASFSWEQTPDNFGETPEMIAASKRADSLRKKALADSVRRKVISDSLNRIKKKAPAKKNTH